MQAPRKVCPCLVIVTFDLYGKSLYLLTLLQVDFFIVSRYETSAGIGLNAYQRFVFIHQYTNHWGLCKYPEEPHLSWQKQQRVACVVAKVLYFEGGQTLQNCEVAGQFN